MLRCELGRVHESIKIRVVIFTAVSKAGEASEFEWALRKCGMCVRVIRIHRICLTNKLPVNKNDGNI